MSKLQRAGHLGPGLTTMINPRKLEYLGYVVRTSGIGSARKEKDSQIL